MARWQDEPQSGQSVWHNDRNGKIVYIDYDNKSAFVTFYEKGHQTFELDVFFGAFDERLNQWILQGE